MLNISFFNVFFLEERRTDDLTFKVSQAKLNDQTLRNVRITKECKLVRNGFFERLLTISCQCVASVVGKPEKC